MRVNWNPDDLLAAKAENLGSKKQSSSHKELEKAAQEFEALFVQMLLSEIGALSQTTTCLATGGLEAVSVPFGPGTGGKQLQAQASA